MAERIAVRPADPDEERRAWAEVVADMRYIGDLVDDKAAFLLPGEHIQEFRDAWAVLLHDFRRVLIALGGIMTDEPPNELEPAVSEFRPTVMPKHLEAAHLSGAEGKLKRSIFARLRDGFLSFFMSEPATEEKLQRAAEEGERCFDFSSILMDSLGEGVRELPGMGLACKGLQEGMLSVKNLLGMRSRRRH